MPGTGVEQKHVWMVFGMSGILELIDKIGKKEASLTEMDFVSPVCGNTQVATRVYGLIYAFDIPATAPGWYKIRPKDSRNAVITGPAESGEIELYLHRFQKVRATMALKRAGIYHGILERSSAADGESVPILLTDDSIQDFDRIVCRFDGLSYWYEAIDSINSPDKAEYLRTSLQKYVPSESIKFSGLLFDEKAAYGMRTEIDKQFSEEIKRKAIRENVEHAGGKLVRFAEKSDHYSVTYSVDGQTYTSYVSKDSTHRVITAGVCLAGTDHKFDLKSLITVMREGQKTGRIHRTASIE